MNWLHDFRQANSGDIVRIEAFDWTMYNEQVSRDDNFKLTRAVIIGEIVKPTPFMEGLVIAPQLFEDETIRCSLVVSYATIINMCVLATRGGIEVSRSEFFDSNANLSHELATSKSAPSWNGAKPVSCNEYLKGWGLGPTNSPPNEQA